jgi:myo-inositol-1(or 4)-monophosphatase
VACGRVDFFFEAFLQPWDFAGGRLLITEAGGCISDFLGGELGMHPATVAAANPRLMVELLAATGRHFQEPFKF